MLRRRSVIIIMTICIIGLFVLIAAPYSPPQQFDQQKWLSGSKSVRGSMVNDINNRRLLDGKTKAEVEQLLGKPDLNANDWWGYEVVTISRCYFWVCRMQVSFDPQTGKAIGGVGVSD